MERLNPNNIFIDHKATLHDLDDIVAIEVANFPEGEAADRKTLEERIISFGTHFVCLRYEGRVISYAGGMVTDKRDFDNSMTTEASMHNEGGNWQMVFTIATLPEYQGQGLASWLVREFVRDARDQGRKGIVILCREEKLAFYKKYGFMNEGKSEFTKGGGEWYQMRIAF